MADKETTSTTETLGACAVALFMFVMLIVMTSCLWAPGVALIVWVFK